MHALPPVGTAGGAHTYGTLDVHALLSPSSRWTLAGGLAGARALEGDGDWLVGDLAVTGRRPFGRRGTLELTTTLAAFRVSSSNVYEALVARAVPAYRWRAGRTSELVVRGHAGLGRSVSRVGSSTVELVEELALVGAGVEGSVLAGPVRLRASTDAYRADEGGSWSWTAGGEVPLGGARLEGQLQLWSAAATDGGERVVFLGSLSVPLGRRASLRSSGGRSAPDPLLGTLPGTYGSALLHVDLTLRPAGAEEPAATLVGPEGGRVAFSWRGSATSVEVLGDFSGWTPLGMEEEGGVWTVTAVVPPGVHRFGFRVDGEWAMSEQVLGRTLDERGVPVGTLVVPEWPHAVGDGEQGEDPLEGPYTAEEVEGLHARLLAAARAGVPRAPLVSRALEARAKGATGAEAFQALDAWALELASARDLVGAAEPPAVLAAAAGALGRGVPEQAVRELMPTVTVTNRALSLVALGDLVGDGVAAEVAFDLVHTASGRANAASLLAALPPLMRRLVRQGWTPDDAALQAEDAIARGVSPPFVELGAGAAGKPPVPPGTGAPRMMGGMVPGGG